MLAAILTGGPVNDTVVKFGLELVVPSSVDVRVAIHDDARQTLPRAGSHDSCLARVDCEPFFQRDGRGLKVKPAGGALEVTAAGERQVVGIPGIVGTG